MKIPAALLENFKIKENLNALIYLGASVFSALVGLVMLRFFTKYLGPEDIGIFGYVTTVNAFLIPLFTINLNSFYIKKVYQSTNSSEPKELLGTIVLFSLVWTIFVIIFLTFFGGWIFGFYKIKVAFYPYMFLTLLSNIFIGATSIIVLQYRILSKAWMYFMINALQTLLLIGMGYAFVGIIHWGIYGRIYGVFIGSTLIGIISVVLLLPYIKWTINKQILKEGLKFSMPLIPYTLAILLYDMLDRVFLERYSSSMASTGIYNIGAQFALIIGMLSLAFYRSYEPVIYKLIEEGNESVVAKKVLMLNNLLLLISILFILFAGPVINYITHGKFTNSVILAALLVIAFYFKSAYILFNTILAAHSKTKEIMIFSLLGLGFIIVTSIFIVPKYNNMGTAYIKTTLYMLMCIGSFFLTKKTAIYKRYILHTLISGIGLFVLVALLNRAGYL